MTVEGKVKLIDFGAACDLCTQINYSPEVGLLADVSLYPSC